MLVKIIYEFDVDVSDFDPEHIDIPGMVVDLAKNEMASLLENHDLEAEDFEYVINDKENNHD